MGQVKCATTGGIEGVMKTNNNGDGWYYKFVFQNVAQWGTVSAVRMTWEGESNPGSGVDRSGVYEATHTNAEWSVSINGVANQKMVLTLTQTGPSGCEETIDLDWLGSCGPHQAAGYDIGAWVCDFSNNMLGC